MIQYKVVTTQTPDGEFHMLLDESDVVRASGFGVVADSVKRLTSETVELETLKKHSYQQYIHEYYAGDADVLCKIPQAQEGSEFQEKVWQAIGSIPYGGTISYKQLAEQAGNAAAIRAAGTICGLNKLILLVPCHRVLKSDGSIGNYLYGPEIKQSLLQRERA